MYSCSSAGSRRAVLQLGLGVAVALALAMLLGGGYIIGVGRGAFVVISLKVNVFRNPFYPTNFPIFGVGAGFGF